MCGIAGYLCDRREPPEIDVAVTMARYLRHRGTDSLCVYRDQRIAMACARLAIVDPLHGDQPIPNEDGSVWTVCNGEIYNHRELRRRLRRAGHVFATGSDVEVVVHLYEEYGTELFSHLNGEFALALWDRRRERLLLARDRIGIRPLFFRATADLVLFGSEVKSLFAHPGLRTSLDLDALDEFLTFWTTVGDSTLFTGIKQVLPGHVVTIDHGESVSRPFWQLPLTPPAGPTGGRADLDELLPRLQASVDLRVPPGERCGVYLSGGIDSAAIAALARERAHGDLHTFSISFGRGPLDESPYQRQIARHLGSVHHELRCSPADIAQVFPEVVWHAETPLMRTAPAPLYELSRFARANGTRVVLSGEGADEILLGYDVHRSARLTMLGCGSDQARDPEVLRALLASDPYVLTGYADAALPALQAALESLHRRSDDVLGVHRFRWARMAAAKRHLTPEARHALRDRPAEAALRRLLPAGFERLDAVTRAQFFDVSTLLRGYLLSSQGDRMSMAHAVETRVPFLDHTFVEYAARLSVEQKLPGLVEKLPLRAALAGRLPESVLTRRKQAYTAPSLDAFVGPAAPDYVADLLSPGHLRRHGVFDPASVRKLLAADQARHGLAQDFVSELVAVLSTQLLIHHFFDGAIRAPEPVRVSAVIDRSSPPRPPHR